MSRFCRPRRALAALSVATAVLLTACAPQSAWIDTALPRPDLAYATNTPLSSAIGCASSGYCFVSGALDGAHIPVQFAYTTTVKNVWTAAEPIVARRLACGSERSCVGTMGDRVIVWNGERWTAQPGAVPGARFVSCASATFCLAVGNPNGTVDRWDGTAWVQFTLLPQPGDGVSVKAVSCPSTGGCTVVGTTPEMLPPPEARVQNHWHEYRWNGSSWDTRDIPEGITALGCVFPARCIALRGDLPPLVRDTRDWTEAAPRSTAQHDNPRLWSLSCAYSDCVASGFATAPDNHTVPVAYRWTFHRPEI